MSEHTFLSTTLAENDHAPQSAKHEPVDEEHVTSAHKKVYEEDASDVDPKSLGSAAALQVTDLCTHIITQSLSTDYYNNIQAFKKFMSGGEATEKKDTKTQLISMAMEEASKLFDQKKGSSESGKQDAVNSAAMTVMKLLVQSKFSSVTGGSNSGGLSGLMSLVSYCYTYDLTLLKIYLPICERD